MVATRRGAQSAPDTAHARSNTLNAPPKRGGRKTTVGEGAGSAPSVSKPIRATASAASRRKAKTEPEADEPHMARKTTTAVKKTTRAPKVDADTEPAPAAPKRMTRGRKAEEHAVADEAVVIEEAVKPATTRGRKAPAKKAPAPKQTPASIVQESFVDRAELAEPVSRVRKALVPKAVAPAPAIAPRATRGRNVAAPPQNSPLKAPARKPTKKAVAAATAIETPVITPAPEPIEEPFNEFPNIPSTPAPFAQNFTARRAMKELAQYPSTPVHILAPMTNKTAMTELPGYPKTPGHIKAPITNLAALAEMASYPNTPAHIKAPNPIAQVITNIHQEPKKSDSFMAPIETEGVGNMDIDDENRMDIDGEERMDTNDQGVIAIRELPDYPATPEHIKAQISNSDALRELPDYPKTPVHIQAPTVPCESPTMMHEASQISPKVASSPETASAHELAVATPNHITSATQDATEVALATPKSVVSKLEEDNAVATPPAQLATPGNASSPISEAYFESGTPRMPANIIWGDTNQEAFGELPAGYPATPAHITAPISTKAALAELPEYPKTPAHIAAPMTPRRALAELPSYPTTPAMAMEAAIQEEISASVKKQTPSPSAKTQSPLNIPVLGDVSFSSAHSELSEAMHNESEVSEAPMPKMTLAPVQLTAPPKLSATFSAPEPASPIKSALRSPQKNDTKTPKKAVTWDDPDESGLSFMYGGPLQGMTFFVEVMRNGRDQSYLFSTLLVDLGAKVVREWENTGITHVLYKDGNKSTLEKVIASKGAIKCLNVGWVIDCEEKRTRLDENTYLVDLSMAMPASPKPVSPKPATIPRTFTPMRTPANQSLPLAIPTTPTSSEFDRSIVLEDKENCEPGIFFDCFDSNEPRTVPHKKSTFLFSRSPIKTPSQPKFLMNTPIKPKSAMKPFSTVGKKRSLEHSFPGVTMAPPKKLRLA